MEFNTVDIHSYVVFANIDNRDGHIYGHRLILSDEQIAAIEQIVLAEKVNAIEEHNYEVEQ